MVRMSGRRKSVRVNNYINNYYCIQVYRVSQKIADVSCSCDGCAVYHEEAEKKEASRIAEIYRSFAPLPLLSTAKSDFSGRTIC